jgi:hypothetical protein
MPARKTKKTSARKPVVKPAITSSMGPTYDTQMVITILLLLFVYPIGLIFMWAWMRNWPVWLKVVISLPFLLAILFFAFMMIVLGSIVRSGRFQQMMYDQQYKHMMQQRQEQQWQITPTPQTYNTY